MKAGDGFLVYVIDQLDGVEELVARPMFGGTGLYAGTVFFGIIFKDILYLKVDDQTRSDYERIGMKPFTPVRPYGRRQCRTTKYRRPCWRTARI